MILFLVALSAFVFGLILGAGLSRSGKSPSRPPVREKSRAFAEDDFLADREFIGVPLSPATRRLDREFEISTELTAQFMRNRNMREAVKIRRERQRLINQFSDLSSG